MRNKFGKEFHHTTGIYDQKPGEKGYLESEYVGNAYRYSGKVKAADYKPQLDSL